MLSERPYRGTISGHEVLVELERESGMQFDPQVVDSTRRLIEKGLLKLGMHSYHQYASGTDKLERNEKEELS
jgi:HD-GYP domain-containing protein (c-di-GMP phosphodiesterase class II)